MFVSTHSLRRAGIGAALALALAVPAAGIATASVANAAPARHTITVAASTRHHAVVTLRASIAKAVLDYRKSIASVQLAFNRDPVVILAKAQRAAIVGTATNPAVILTANHAFWSAISGPLETRNAGFDSARTTRFAAVDAAWAAYDLVVNPANAIARNAYRAAMRSANYQLRTHVALGHRAFRVATAAPHAQLRASINTAIQAYEASAKTPADLATFSASLTVARTTFQTNPAVVAAAIARHNAIRTAWVTYAHSVRAARIAFHSATGHWPHATRVILPLI